MSNPVVDVKKVNIVLELIAFMGLCILVILPIYYNSNLPDTIAVHFNAQGQPDGFGNTSSTSFFLF